MVNPLPAAKADAMERVGGNVDLKTDDKTITVTDNVKNSPVSLAKQDLTDNVTDNINAAKNSVKSDFTTVIVTDKTKKGMCEFCGTEFEKTVSWKRHCSDDCRIANWERKNGKQWKSKATAGKAQ